MLNVAIMWAYSPDVNLDRRPGSWPTIPYRAPPGWEYCQTPDTGHFCM